MILPYVHQCMLMVMAYLDALHEQACLMQLLAQAMQRTKEEENAQLLKQLQVSSWSHVCIDCTAAMPYSRAPV